VFFLMTLANADVHNWLNGIPGATRTIESLVADGFHGFSISDLLPWLNDAHVRKRFDAISWLKTTPDSSGEVALMTADEQALDDLLSLFEMIFADMKEIYGNQAHLYRIDYGCFMHHMETQGGVVFSGEFIDLDSREIHTFTMDAIQQRLRHQSTGRFLDGNSQSEDEGTR
jgi:hypothetical protein